MTRLSITHGPCASYGPHCVLWKVPWHAPVALLLSNSSTCLALQRDAKTVWLTVALQCLQIMLLQRFGDVSELQVSASCVQAIASKLFSLCLLSSSITLIATAWGFLFSFFCGIRYKVYSDGQVSIESNF